MRLVCISDTHGYHRRLTLPAGDVLIHAGDFLTDDRQLEMLVDFNDWLGELSFQHRIVVAGNHDVLFATHRSQAEDLLSHAVYLENSGITIAGLHFWGCPVTPVLPYMAFAVERGPGSRKYWDKVPNMTDVLITHGPPYRVRDTDDLLGLCFHTGCEELTRAVLRTRPQLHVFGHAHGGYGQEPGPNGTLFVNCAVLERIGSVELGIRDPILVELDDFQ